MQLLFTFILVGLVSASAFQKGGRQSAAYLVGRGFVLRDLQSRQNTCENNSGASNCQEYCGADWASCATDNYCYNPQVHVCCSNGWHCDKGQYCIDGNRCCPDGTSLEECDATETVSTIGGPATAPPGKSTLEPGTVVTTPTPIITSTQAAPTTITTTLAPPPSPAPTNVGAIVGGVIGGVAVVGLILLGILFLRRRRTAHGDAQPIQGQNNTATSTPPNLQQPVSLVEPTHNPVTSSYQSERLQSTGSPANTAVSPASKGGWMSPSPAPLYEAPGNEQLIHQPAYEIEGSQPYYMSRY